MDSELIRASRAREAELTQSLKMLSEQLGEARKYHTPVRRDKRGGKNLCSCFKWRYALCKCSHSKEFCTVAFNSRWLQGLFDETGKTWVCIR